MKKLFQISLLFIISLTHILSSELSNYFDNLTTDFLEHIDKTAHNINTKTIQYSLNIKSPNKNGRKNHKKSKICRFSSFRKQ